MINNALEWKKFQFMKTNEEINSIFEKIDIEDLLNKYGPEGLYDLAKELMKVADKDISDWHPEKEGFEKQIKEAGDQYDPGHTSPFEGKRPGAW